MSPISSSEQDLVAEVTGLFKNFKLYSSPADRIKEIILRRPFHQTFSALENVTFSVPAGQTLGIIGRNGAGKSTLLKLIMGILLPDAGSIKLNGKTTGLLELGTGFNHDLSGRANVFFNGTFLGMDRDEIEEKLPSILEFSELGPFVDEPLKTYSSGMIMRLAFSIAIHADPTLFLIDEALSVGDAYFQQKCMDRIRKFRDSGGSILFVSHELNAVKVLCDTAILLENGKVVIQDRPDIVIDEYNRRLAPDPQDLGAGSGIGQSGGYGDGTVVIEELNITDCQGNSSPVFSSGAPCFITLKVRARSTVKNLSAGILLRDRLGQDIFGTNTFYLGKEISITADSTLMLKFHIKELNLAPGKYTLSIALHEGAHHTSQCFHWIDRAGIIDVAGPGPFQFTGLARLELDMEISDG